MAYIRSRTLFFTTSPRTPLKMLSELKILSKFKNQKWNQESQVKFIDELANSDEFQGIGSIKDKAFSARDRINRAPKSLGFVDLSPVISITKAGQDFIEATNKEEVLLRQLLKFQLPSPYHKETEEFKGIFNVKPYLEIFRLIDSLEYLSFDELMIFGMQLTHYKKFNEVVLKIENFRKEKAQTKLKYKDFKNQVLEQELSNIYYLEIISGSIKTRESKEISRAKFIATKASNLRDYTDAAFRYLRATGMVEISQSNYSISIAQDKKVEVKFFLKTINKKPNFITDEAKYKTYLFDKNKPKLYYDDKERLLKRLTEASQVTKEISSYSIKELKEILTAAINSRKEQMLKRQIKDLKTYKSYDNVMKIFKNIQQNKLYDAPLILEWNVWRALTMLNGGEIKANLKFDDNGIPMSNAGGNMPDIVCDYGEFGVIAEVTMQSGHRQYEMESESVSRHLASFKKSINKEAYCLFIAPKINESCIAYFYALHKINIQYYGGKSVIVPLELDVFIDMLEKSRKIRRLTPKEMCKIFLYSEKQAQIATDEKQWYDSIKNKILNGIF